jgi:hypothetical protein
MGFGMLIFWTLVVALSVPRPSRRSGQLMTAPGERLGA